MSSANKARGTRYESELAQLLQDNGIDARRLPRTGVKDIGDISFPFRNGTFAVVEAKNRRGLDLPTYLAEAALEADQFEAKYPAAPAAYPIVMIKRRGKGPANSYVVFDLEEWLHMMRQLGAL